MAQQVKTIDITRSFIPVDPKQFPATLHGTSKEDAPEERVPVVPYKGYNFLPTNYGYKSYFGISSKIDISLLSSDVDWVFIVQAASYENKLIALTSDGIYTAIAGTGATAVWTHEIVLTNAHVLWTYCVIENVLYCYRQGGAKLYKLDLTLPALSFVEVTPTFLNMAGQIGIFKAGGRLGFWDSANSVSWSNIDDTGDFVPSLETLAGNTIFQDVLGRITIIYGDDAGFNIYSTKSIVHVTRTYENTMMWDTSILFSEIGVAYPRQVARCQPDTLQYAYTAAGIIKIDKGKAEFIITAVHDLLAGTKLPIYLRYLSGRYLFLEVLDKDFLYGLVEFETSTLLSSLYLPEWTAAYESMSALEDPTTTYSPTKGVPLNQYLGIAGAHDQHVLQKTRGPLTSYPRDLTDIPEFDGFYEFPCVATNVDPTYLAYAAIQEYLTTVALQNPSWTQLSSYLLRPYFLGEFSKRIMCHHATGESFTKRELTTTDEVDIINNAIHLWGKLDRGVEILMAEEANPTYDQPVVDESLTFEIPTDLVMQSDLITPRTVWTGTRLQFRTELLALASLVKPGKQSRKLIVNGPGYPVTRLPPQEVWVYTKWDKPAIGFNDTGICIQRNAIERTKYALAEFVGFLDTTAVGSVMSTPTDPEFIFGTFNDFAEFLAGLDARIGMVDSDGWTLIEYRIGGGDASFTGTVWNNDDASSHTWMSDWGIASVVCKLHWTKAGNNALSDAYFKVRTENYLGHYVKILAVETLAANVYTQKAYTKLVRYYKLDSNGNRVSSVTPPPTFVPINPNSYKTNPAIKTTIPTVFAHSVPAANNAFVQTGDIVLTFNDPANPGTTDSVTFVYSAPAISFPPDSFLMQKGAIAPQHPVLAGAFVYDTQLKKWGSLRADYFTLLDYSPLNSSDTGIIPYAVFGMQAGAVLTDNTISLFSENIEDSQIFWGKIGYYRQGVTTVQEVRVTFRTPATGFCVVEGSLDNITIEAGLTQFEAFTGVLSHTLRADSTAKWFNVGFTGQFDITGLEFRGNTSGRR